MKRYILLFLALVTINVVFIVLASKLKNTNNQEVIADTEGTEVVEVTLDDNIDREYKIAMANNDSYEVISSEDSFEKAKEKVTNVSDDNLIIVKDDVIIYVKFGLIDLKTKPYSVNTTFHVDGKENYINGSTAQDALFIDTHEDKYEMLISSARGMVDNIDVLLVPLAQIKSPSYYFLNSFDELVHAISTNIYEEDSYAYSGTIDKAPDYLKQGEKYYSYDGMYFYKDIKDLILDSREETTNRAVNHADPFYAYYLYLSMRNLTSYSSTDINKYLNYSLERLGYINSSVLVNTGQYFINAQNSYKVNAIYELAWAIHESAFGTSSIAVNKYNLFGLNATDNNPYGNSTDFTSIQAGINYHANTYVDDIYLNNDYYRYSGEYVGNKGNGFNVFYASDPYWGEKIAAQYFQIDKYLGFKDYQKYQLEVV